MLNIFMEIRRLYRSPVAFNFQLTKYNLSITLIQTRGVHAKSNVIEIKFTFWFDPERLYKFYYFNDNIVFFIVMIMTRKPTFFSSVYYNTYVYEWCIFIVLLFYYNIEVCKSKVQVVNCLCEYYTGDIDSFGGGIETRLSPAP